MKKQTPDILLRDKGEFTKFQILLEVMRKQPHIKQKDISNTIGITIQAISKYFKKLAKEGFLDSSSERGNYRLTSKGKAHLREELKRLDSYVKSVRKELKVDHAWIAIATLPVKTGEQVGLITKGGIFYTVSVNDTNVESTGIATNDAISGEDIGLRDLKGKIKLKQGKILIIKLPSIRKGGSRAVDIEKIKGIVKEFKPDRIGVMGAVGRAVSNKLKLEPDIEFGISHSAVIAASRGLNVLVFIVGRMANKMIQEIDSQNMRSANDIIYEVKDARIIEENS
ncbi:MAG: winged helix-turn-helix transcriptional regulator [Candidatus Bathyarchaeota archaeon]|nr:winged helix-turn-helix transcriptional regulator [Candidatus Termiticorpusculum sp.]